MLKTRILSLGLIVFQFMNMLGMQKAALAATPPKPLSQAVVVEYSITALAQVLHKWSGHRRYENLAVALAEAANKADSTDPLVMTAARMADLGVALNRPELYREGVSVIKALRPDIAANLRDNQQLLWRIDRPASMPTIYERLAAKQTNKQIFEARIFASEDTEGESLVAREERRYQLDVSDARIQSSEDYIDDALYGSFEDQLGGARESRNSPLVQRILADRAAESTSALDQYGRDIVDDGLRAAGVVGLATKSGNPYVLGGAFAAGALYGAITKHDDYVKAREAEDKEKQQKAPEKKAEQEQAEKEDSDRKQKAKEDEDEVNRLAAGEQASNTGSEVNPNRSEDGGSGILRMREMLKSFHKLINVREDIDSNQGLLAIAQPNSGRMDPSRFDREIDGSAVKLKLDHMDITNPGSHQLKREVGR